MSVEFKIHFDSVRGLPYRTSREEEVEICRRGRGGQKEDEGLVSNSYESRLARILDSEGLDLLRQKFRQQTVVSVVDQFGLRRD